MRTAALPSIGILALALIACGQDTAPCPVCAARAAAEAARTRVRAPHGGTIVVSRDHRARFEIVHDGADQRVDLYVYDADMRPLAAADAPVLNLVRKGKTYAVDGEGAADRWTFSNWRLGVDPVGRFRIEIGDLTYVPTLTHTHAEEVGHGHGDPTGPAPDSPGPEDEDDERDER